MHERRRVVVTGLGIISPVGNQLETAWQNILAGKSGISLIDSFDTHNYPTRIAGLVRDFDLSHYGILAKDARKMDSFIQYGLAAAIDAITLAGLENASLEHDRIGVAVGSGIGGLELIEKTYQDLTQQGPRRVSPFFIPGTIINMIAGHISIKYGFRGPNIACTTACTTGAHNIGLAARLIAYGDADVMIAGGSEKASTPLGMSGFSAARALSVRNDEPTLASRPWDKGRDGFVLGDGAGVLVLEEYEHAKKRNATIYAELIGFGMSGSGYHMTQISPGGEGEALAISRALNDANLAATALNYVNAHGTSTMVGDSGECQALKAALKEHAYKIPISSTKSMTGHLLGAAGAIEAIFTILALRDQVVPPTINLDDPSEDCDLDFVPHTARKLPLKIALSNSFGFGGTNGALIFQKI